MYDIIIVGAGPAGISAGIYAVSRGMKTVILEKNEVGGLIGKVSTVTHYTAVAEHETGKTLEKIILANGTSPRKLEIPGEDELAKKGMSLNAAKHGAQYAGKHVYVVGGADGAIKEALYLSRYASKVTMIHFEEQLGCIAEFRNKVEQTPNMELRLHSRLHGVYGVDQVETLEIADERTGAIETIEDPGCGIFVYTGTMPNTECYQELALEKGFIPVNENMETEIEGVYAVGDIRVKQVRQVSTAVADGTIAAIHAAQCRGGRSYE